MPTRADEIRAEGRFGFNPAARAMRPWLWHVESDGRLCVVAASGQTFPEPNYDGDDGPMVGGSHAAHHFWKPLNDA